MEDTVLLKSKEFLNSLDELILKYDICSSATDSIKPMLAYSVTDIMVHFILVPLVDVVWYERWKQQMWLRDYCLWAMSEIDEWNNWDINWLCWQYWEDNRPEFNDIFKYIYKSFIELC